MYFSAPLVAAMVMAMLPSAFASPVAAAAEPTVFMGTFLSDTEVAALGLKVPADLIETTDDSEGQLTKRSFRGSCGVCEMTGGSSDHLNCYCNAGSAWRWSQLNLNLCIANSNGMLVWRANGAYRHSCTGYPHLYNSQTLQTGCIGPSGTLVQSNALNLNERVHNWSGQIGCSV